MNIEIPTNTFPPNIEIFCTRGVFGHGESEEIQRNPKKTEENPRKFFVLGAKNFQNFCSQFLAFSGPKIFKVKQMQIYRWAGDPDTF